MAETPANNLLIYGAGDFGHLVKNIIRHTGFVFAGFVSDRQTGPEILGPFESAHHCYPASDYSLVIGVGYSDLKNRWALFEKAKAHGYRVPALIHPKAYVADSARVAEGCIVMGGALVDFNACLQELAVLWPGSIVNHDSTIGRNTFLSPGAIVCGFSEVGPDSFVGAGVTVVDHVKVPANAFLKAGRLYTGKSSSPKLPL